ncbi:GntR family transcriptional regulator [Citricoccus sp.]|uniref:FadR/GntR family transcriptional regulator n=1 Tax=Citricoccus sp. TaxID=1978372 RepID=UPI0028BDDB0B|nr:GntR family transcriptional regulator [Citricoccus sp.]
MTSTPTRSGPSRTEALVDQLRRGIVGGELVPGQKLPSESQLVTEHGVSRTVVREAILRLQTEGLVHTKRGSGSYVLTPPSEHDAGSPVPRAAPTNSVAGRMDLIDYRVAIESEAAALAAARRSEALAEGVRRAERAFSVSAGAPDPGGPAALLRLDFAFHRSVAEASGSALLLQALDALGPAMIAMPRERLVDAESQGPGGDGSGADGAGPAVDGPARAEPSAAGRRATVVAAEHAAVAAAVVAGDAPGAAAAMRTHLRNSARRFREESTGR